MVELELSIHSEGVQVLQLVAATDLSTLDTLEIPSDEPLASR